MTKEFLINEHRITFYKNIVEIEEFDKNNDFVSRVFMNHDDFKTLIKSYDRWKRDENK